MTETMNALRTAEQAYAASREEVTQAWKQYSDACDLFYRGSIDRPTLEAAYKKASDLDNQAAILWKAKEAAKVAHLTYLESQDEDCDCNPISTCEPCTKRARNQDLEF